MTDATQPAPMGVADTALPGRLAVKEHPLDAAQNAATLIKGLIDAAQHLANECDLDGAPEAVNGLFAVLTAAQDAAGKLASDLDRVVLPRT